MASQGAWGAFFKAPRNIFVLVQTGPQLVGKLTTLQIEIVDP